MSGYLDEGFFKKLDEALTNVGADRYLERKIGGHVVWLSPVPFKSQHKINEVLTSQALGASAINEAKRMTLSYAIVGFDGIDLRPYRNDTPQFPIYDQREKKQVTVTLYKYMSHKMEEWGIEWIDSAFEVFADIIETIKKDNLKDIKFENAKDKHDELSELEDRIRALRIELNMPPLIEASTEDKTPQTDLPSKAVEEPPSPPPFNPFQKIPQPYESVHNQDEHQVVQPRPVQTNKLPAPAISSPMKSEFGNQKKIDAETSSPENPYVVGQRDVLEERAVRERLPIEIDPVRNSVNPRFKAIR